MKTILKVHPEIDVKHSQCLTPAISNNQFETVRYLISQGANPNQGALCRAARDHNPEMLDFLISLGGSFEHGYCLHELASEGDVEAGKLVISRGADPSAGPDNLWHTPVMRVIYFGHYEYMVLLVDSGADIDRKAKFGNSPLHQATEEARLSGDYRYLDYLLEHGAKVNTYNDRGRSPLHMAFSNPELQQYLKDHGARNKPINLRYFWDGITNWEAIFAGH